MKSTDDKRIIGRKDFASFPDFSLIDVEVKIDTGAYTSSIHVSHCQEVEKNGIKSLEVVFLDEQNKSFTGNTLYFPMYRIKKVRSSNGHEQLRFFIKGKIVLLDKIFTTEFSLTKRNGLRCPILIGRKVLNNRFIVDTSLNHLSKNTKK
ncbi:MAG: RimK/LysX family protein [Bacteroidota bacterium]